MSTDDLRACADERIIPADRAAYAPAAPEPDGAPEEAPSPAALPAGSRGERPRSILFGLVAYLLLVAAILGLIALGVLALMRPAIVPVIQILTHQTH